MSCPGCGAPNEPRCRYCGRTSTNGRGELVKVSSIHEHAIASPEGVHAFLQQQDIPQGYRNGLLAQMLGFSPLRA